MFSRRRYRQLALQIILTFGLLGVFFPPIAYGLNKLPGPVQKIVRANKVPQGGVSLVVQEITTDAPLLSLNPAVARNPASTIKLLTTFIALDLLGPAYTWPTELYAHGRVVDSVLQGDLILKGYGDPYMLIEEFWKMLGALRREGVETIEGDLIFDDSHFSIPSTDPGSFDQQPYRLYNVVPNAALVNFKAVQFLFEPARDGKSVNIQTLPALPNLKITNKLSIKKSRCRGFQRGIKMDLSDPSIGDHVIFSGAFPSGCRSYSLHRSVLRPASYAFGTFQRLWGHWGGTIKGVVRDGSAVTTQIPLVVWRSRPLSQVIRAANKWSNNVMTRLLVYTLASEKFEPPYTREQGLEVMYDYLRENDIGTTNLILDNGSGLSRGARVTADLMTALLHHAYRNPYMPEFIASMSINGHDGTTRRRFRGRVEAGRMHLKTGRLDGVAAIAGYVHAASGKLYSVVLLINHPGVHKGPGVAIQNAVLKWVHQQ